MREWMWFHNKYNSSSSSKTNWPLMSQSVVVFVAKKMLFVFAHYAHPRSRIIIITIKILCLVINFRFLFVRFFFSNRIELKILAKRKKRWKKSHNKNSSSNNKKNLIDFCKKERKWAALFIFEFVLVEGRERERKKITITTSNRWPLKCY